MLELESNIESLSNGVLRETLEKCISDVCTRITRHDITNDVTDLWVEAKDFVNTSRQAQLQLDLEMMTDAEVLDVLEVMNACANLYT